MMDHNRTGMSESPDTEDFVAVTITHTQGSVPRKVGARMLVFPDRRILGTIGGGKFEDLVIDAALEALRGKTPRQQTWPLHEHAEDSFGAICGGEVTVFLDPQLAPKRLFIVGAGHCSVAIARVAELLGYVITVIDDRPIGRFPEGTTRILDRKAAEVFAEIRWRSSDAVVLVSRNFHIDREALRARLSTSSEIGYIGMIGSKRKVKQVFEELKTDGVPEAALKRVRAPIGLDIGAESPAEIAVSVMGEIIAHP